MDSVYPAKEKCCGCGACGIVCPVGAIEMRADGEGFPYPSIDRSRCIECLACLWGCPFHTEGHFKRARYPEFYAAKHRDEAVLMASASGGAFTAVSDFVLRRGGVVYGAAFDENFRVVHGRAETPEGRDRFRGSKYVQSCTREAYVAALDDLKRGGRPVLFTGTPCQAAGMRALALGKGLEENLYTCDLICHGIPSPLIWEEYKKLLERENGGRLTGVSFRSKTLPWTRRNSKNFEFRTTASPDLKSDGRFYGLFFRAETILRRSCYACPFTDVHRVSDITIADYWGIEKYLPEFYDPKGVSLILTNSPKGEKLFEAIKDDLIVRPRPPEESLKEQKRLSEPTPLPSNMEEFWNDFRERGFEYVAEKYAQPT